MQDFTHMYVRRAEIIIQLIRLKLLMSVMAQILIDLLSMSILMMSMI